MGEINVWKKSFSLHKMYKSNGKKEIIDFDLASRRGLAIAIFEVLVLF